MTIPITITIPAATTGSGVLTYKIGGSYFLLQSAGGAIQVQTDTGKTYNLVNPGDGFGDASSPAFRRLTFYNSAGTPVTVVFYASNEPIRIAETAINNSITATATLTNTLANCALEAENQAQLTYNGAAVQFAPAGTYWRRLIIVAQKSLDRAANTGNVYIGLGAAHQPITLAPGAIWTFNADTGGKRDLGSWYMSADDDGDGISILYL